MLLWDISLSTSISIIRGKKKLLSLNRHPIGSFSTKPYVRGMELGQYIFSSCLPKNFWYNKLPGSFVLLKHLHKFCIVSNIFINNLNKYATANGTFCQILDIFYDFNLIKIVLPSKNTKILTGSTFVTLGRNSQINSRHCYLGKAGVTINNGKKPKVRGVARNPVDHPHGGRTKTNQPEVSIWGWVAKRNK